MLFKAAMGSLTSTNRDGPSHWPSTVRLQFVSVDVIHSLGWALNDGDTSAAEDALSDAYCLAGGPMWENWRFEEVKKMVCAPSSTPPKWRLAGGHHRWWTRTGTQPAKPSAGKVVLQVCGKAGRSTFTSRVPVARPRPIGR